MKCIYSYKGKQFQSIQQLDDFLLEKQIYESKYGDLVFSMTEKQLSAQNRIDSINKEAEELNKKYAEAKKNASFIDSEEILKMIFDDVEITDRQDLFFTCDCSREKMINALSTIGKQELQSMIDEDHGCEITCQFCNTKYKFDEEELQKLINRL